MNHAAPSPTHRRAPDASRPATLPMYDLPELRDDHDTLWHALRDALLARNMRGVPDTLNRDIAPRTAWSDPRLLLAQTCGYPFASALHGRVRLVATPCYDLPGCHGPRYRSWLIARTNANARTLGDFRRRRVAINAPDSLSGCKVLEMMLPRGESFGSFFAAVHESGAHADSITAVARGDADLAAIDCVTWALLERHRPAHLEGVRIVGRGPLLPALPLITGASTSDDELAMLRKALAHVVAAPGIAATRQRLGLRRFERVGDGAYLAILSRLPRDQAG